MWKILINGNPLSQKGIPYEFESTKEARRIAKICYSPSQVKIEISGDHPCKELIKCEECVFLYGSCLHEEGMKDDL